MNPPDFIGVASETLVYVGMTDREAFDKIGAPVHDHGEKETGHVLSKTVGNFGRDEVTVIFQHWLKSGSQP
ncbi:MAG: hypothetical protein EOS11_28745 [Mesorhizobium sp.]|nr:MAG: hypothetical protein EOS11_28745 [Mesorhizobium sp.]